MNPSSSGFRLFLLDVGKDYASVAAWKAEPDAQATITDLSDAYVTWLQVGRASYGKHVLADWVFELGEDRKVESLANREFEVVLEEQS